MIRLLTALLFAGSLLLAAPARAFTPESGWWWNPAEPGYGFSIEIQDNYIFMVAFSYTGPGDATWYAAQGTMANREAFLAQMYSAQDGTCLGCAYTPQTAFAIGGPIEIDFLTETTAELTWGGRTIPVQRHDYRLTRNPNLDPKTELWLGEWQAVLDLSDFGGSVADYPFVGEVLVFDLLLSESNGEIFDGCRPGDNLIGACAANPVHPASGFYAESTDTNVIIVYDNDGNSGSDPDDDEYFVYEVRVGLTQFDGYGKICFADELDDLFDLCLDNNAVTAFGIQGWRSKSRAFVQGDDNAPNGAPTQLRRAGGKRGEGGTPTSRGLRPHQPRASVEVAPAVQQRDEETRQAVREVVARLHGERPAR